jgi:hypothetical protein
MSAQKNLTNFINQNEEQPFLKGDVSIYKFEIERDPIAFGFSSSTRPWGTMQNAVFVYQHLGRRVSSAIIRMGE